MNKKQTPRVPGLPQIWIATVAAVVIILGLAFVISGAVKTKKIVPDAAPVVVAAVPVTPEPVPAVIEEKVVAAPAPTVVDVPSSEEVASLTPIAPAVTAPVDTGVKLQLDKLAGTLKVSSTGVMASGRLNLEHTCYRRGPSMPVLWSGAPSSTKSYVLTMEEHKPGELPFVKWLVFNIPADSKGLPAGLPQAEAFEGGIRQGRNDHGGVGYTGPCIPKGQINYKLRLFALDTTLDVPTTQKFESFIPAMNGHIVDAVDLAFYHYFKR